MMAFWVWISAVTTEHQHLKANLSIGVDDMVGRDADGELLPIGAEGHGEKEYSKEDG